MHIISHHHHPSPELFVLTKPWGCPFVPNGVLKPRGTKNLLQVTQQGEEDSMSKCKVCRLSTIPHQWALSLQNPGIIVPILQVSRDVRG